MSFLFFCRFHNLAAIQTDDDTRADLEIMLYRYLKDAGARIRQTKKPVQRSKFTFDSDESQD